MRFLSIPLHHSVFCFHHIQPFPSIAYIAETGISEPLLEKQLCKIAKDKGIDLNAGSAKAVPRALIYTPGGQPPFVANDNYGAPW